MKNNYAISLEDMENIKRKVGLDHDMIMQIEQVMLIASDDILRVYNGDIKVLQKGNSSHVTIADKKASDTITEMLRNNFDIPVISEETIEDFEYKDFIGKTYFLIDPIDGTKHFIKKDGEFSINIALMHDKVAVAGFVYMPVLDILYYSLPGEGAYKVENLKDFNSKPVRIYANKFGKNNDASIRVISGQSTKSNSLTKEFLSNLEVTEDVEISSHGSSYKMCLIAEGKRDICPRFGGTCEWDTAAPFPILKEAGGTIYTVPQKEEMTFLRGSLDWENPYFIAMGNVDPKWICSLTKVKDCRIDLRERGELKAYENLK